MFCSTFPKHELIINKLNSTFGTRFLRKTKYKNKECKQMLRLVYIICKVSNLVTQLKSYNKNV